MIDPSSIFTGFFVTLGPLKTLGPFAQRTRDVPPAALRQIALWTSLVATIGGVAGGLIGRALLVKWHVSLPALMLTGGIVFFIVALRQLLEQYEPPHLPAQAEQLPASPLAAACRLVFPIVLTPYGIAAVIALLAASESTARTVDSRAARIGDGPGSASDAIREVHPSRPCDHHSSGNRRGARRAPGCPVG
jgi:multiple antibiotic resistance protein